MIDFAAINQQLLMRTESYLNEWLPGGKIKGREFICGDFTGKPGRSLSINLDSGIWCDFSTDIKGGDLISLYAAINNLTQIESAKRLSGICGCKEVSTAPVLKHPKYGHPSDKWTYKNEQGDAICVVARYPTSEGKTYLPWVYDQHSGGWKCRGLPQPRPLYNLDKIVANPKARILICEGEKTCDAASKIVGHRYICTTWLNGSKAVNRVDWSPVYGREVIIYPDADYPGVEAAFALVKTLSKHCTSIKVIDPGGMPVGWDLADCDWNFDELLAWSKSRVALVRDKLVPFSNPFSVDAEVMPDIPLAQSTNVPEETDSGPITEANFALWDKLGLPLTANGSPIPNLVSCRLVFSNDERIKDKLFYDTFVQKIMFNGYVLSDIDELRICEMLQLEYGIRRIDTSIVSKAIALYAADNEKNCVCDWIKSIKWDGKERIRKFFPAYCGSDDNMYTNTVSLRFWVGIIARAFRPGCQLDTMVVLQGKQGAYKSSMLRILGGDWYTESSSEMGTKDFLQSLKGRLILEISELESFRRASVEAIKKTLSCPVDFFREPYTKHTREYKRTCVFVGTTNQDEFLGDATGARRFWPITVTECNIKMVREDREQLFAEAYKLYLDGEDWHTIDERLVKENQELHNMGDAWDEIVEEALCTGLSGINPLSFTSTEMATDILKVELSRVDKIITRRLTDIFKRLGCKQFVTSKTVNGKRLSYRAWRNEEFALKCYSGEEFDIDV